MTEELKQAAQQALEALSLALSDVDWRVDSPTQPVIHKAHSRLQRALAQRPAAKTEREAFEARYGMHHPDVYRDTGGTYGASEVLNIAWTAWQARASLPATQQATPELDDCRKRPRCGRADPCAWLEKQATPDPVSDAKELHDRLMRIAEGVDVYGAPSKRLRASQIEEIARAILALRPAAAPAVQWFTVADHGMPDVGEEVIGGLWYTDPWLKPEFTTRFMWGLCRVVADDHRDFKNGKRWQTFGPSHSQITHWARLNMPAITAQGAGEVQG